MAARERAFSESARPSYCDSIIHSARLTTIYKGFQHLLFFLLVLSDNDRIPFDNAYMLYL